MAKKILIVEDSATVCALLNSLFSEQGYEVIIAESGEQVAEKIRTQRPDLAIVDTLLPGMDGFEVTKQIKDLDKSIKIIVTTGTIDAIDATKARRSGADDYVVKTADFAPLVEAAKNLI